MARSLFERIVEVIFYLLLIWLTIQVVLKLTGNSPSIESILITGLGVVMSYLLTATLKIAHFMGQVGEFMKNSKESFKVIREDIERLKRRK